MLEPLAVDSRPTLGHGSPQDSAANARINLQKLSKWADDASRAELTEQLLEQAEEIQRLDDIAAMLSIENASLLVRVRQLEAVIKASQLAQVQASLTPLQDSSTDDGPTRRYSMSDNPIMSFASFRKAKELCRNASPMPPKPNILVSESEHEPETRLRSHSASATLSPALGSSATSSKTFNRSISGTPSVESDKEEYTQRHHDAARIIQSHWRRRQLEARFRAVKKCVRRRSIQRSETSLLAEGTDILSQIAAEVLGPDKTPSAESVRNSFASPSVRASAAFPEETELAEPDLPLSVTRLPTASPTLKPASPSPARTTPINLHEAAAVRTTPAPKPPVKTFTPLLAAAAPEASLSPATRIEQSAMALTAAFQDDSDPDESMASSRTQSPEPNADARWNTIESAITPAESQRKRRIGIYYFNKDPRKGVDWLMNQGILRDEAKDVAHFFHTEPGLNRRMIGEYLGNVINSFNMNVLDAYVDQFDLKSMTFDHALRFFIASFRLPGEAQKIERILECFAKKYHASNPGLFGSEDTPFVLAFSVVMLNTDAHNAANKRKMTKEDWIRNNRGIDSGKDMPRVYLEEIYDRISAEEFQMLPDNTSMIERVAADIIGLKDNLVASHRQFVRMVIASEIEDSDRTHMHGKHTRALYLFNDRLVVTKPRGNHKFTYRQHYNLTDMTVLVERSSKQPHPVMYLLNRQNACAFKFSIDPSARGCAHFESELREMIATCTDIENERIRREESSSRRSLVSEASCDDKSDGSPRKMSLFAAASSKRMWGSKKKPVSEA
eukprot:m.247668 g.247668  ORF g.247668 m.247668 type:complete len:786 (-) comp15456_c0_seq1:276-2633(-)